MLKKKPNILAHYVYLKCMIFTFLSLNSIIYNPPQMYIVSGQPKIKTLTTQRLLYLLCAFYFGISFFQLILGVFDSVIGSNPPDQIIDSNNKITGHVLRADHLSGNP